eukprot:TRINITY_DN976_c0_g1_i1.p2 TRINITY_DN976_c0_g1~~TRINITY_DN976_c0_g1_i1.p2  ORF type:complete len:270 (-),score=30.00 TRINITY_DN976_c0_g1_i1:490-1299(-)
MLLFQWELQVQRWRTTRVLGSISISFLFVYLNPFYQSQSQSIKTMYKTVRQTRLNSSLFSKAKSQHNSTNRKLAVNVACKFQKIEGDKRIIRGKVFVTQDNIDTDQIIPAEYLTLVPSKADEYEKLGSYAMIGLPDGLYPTRFVSDGEMKTQYEIVIGGENFGCGSSREHAPVSMGASGAKVVVAQSFARIFFRNCMSTGELYPVETDQRLCEKLSTGEEVEVDMENDILTQLSSGQQFSLKPLGEAGPVIDSGGIFQYAREQGLIKTV